VGADFQELGYSSLPGESAVQHRYAANASDRLRRYGFQFHPEVDDTLHGSEMIGNFVLDICGYRPSWTMKQFMAEEMAKVQADPTAMIAGLREVGKMCGYYEPVKKQIDVNITGNVVMERLNRLSDADLLKLIEDQTASTLEGEFIEVAEGDEDE
jgi:hypothetical protein